MNFINTILRAATREDNENLNILLHTANERYESLLLKTGHHFFALNARGMPWRRDMANVPIFEKYAFLRGEPFPPDIVYDLLLCLDRNNLSHAAGISYKFHLPVVYLENKEPHNNYKLPENVLQVFLTDEQRESWEASPDKSIIAGPMIDEVIFVDNPNLKRESKVLTVMDDWLRKGKKAGYRKYLEIVKGLNNTKVIGYTPQISSPVHLDDLITEYQQSLIYLNVSEIHSVPLQVLEAMACGCAIVSTETSSLCKIVNEANGFLSNNIKELRANIDYLLKNPQVALDMGQRNREKIVKNFGYKRGIATWKEIFAKAADMSFTEILK